MSKMMLSGRAASPAKSDAGPGTAATARPRPCDRAPEDVTHAPREYVVIGAGRVAAHADSADDAGRPPRTAPARRRTRSRRRLVRLPSDRWRCPNSLRSVPCTPSAVRHRIALLQVRTGSRLAAPPSAGSPSRAPGLQDAPEPEFDADPASRLNAFAALAFCAEMTRLPSHCASAVFARESHRAYRRHPCSTTRCPHLDVDPARFRGHRGGQARFSAP